MSQAIYAALKPGGKLVLIEYRAEDPLVPIKRLHKMTQRQARKEMQAVGFRWESTGDFLPQQHFMVFVKPLAPSWNYACFGALIQPSLAQIQH